MRAPRIRFRTRKAGLKLKVKTFDTGCPICKDKSCVEERTHLIDQCDRLTRSMSKLIRELDDIIIYETYRCMPLLGDEKVNAPDWEEHIVKYQIVFVKSKP